MLFITPTQNQLRRRYEIPTDRECEIGGAPSGWYSHSVLVVGFASSNVIELYKAHGYNNR